MNIIDGWVSERVQARLLRMGKVLGAGALLASLAWVGARAPAHALPLGPAPHEAASSAASSIARESSVLPAVAPAAREVIPPCKDGAHVEGAVLADGRVILNRAGYADLMQLPGVGEKRARAVVALRDRLGRFRSLRDLLRVRGLGPKLLRRLEPKTLLDAPDEQGQHAEPRHDEPRGRGA